MKNNILLIPESNRHYGIGHFKRLAFYLATARLHADIYIPDEANQIRLGAYCNQEIRDVFVSHIPANQYYQLVLVDTFIITARAVKQYRQFGLVICALDARGNGADYCDYVIDILPRVRGRAGNITAPELLPISHPAATPSANKPAAAPTTPISSTTTNPNRTRALVYFSGHSSGRLISRAIRMLCQKYPADFLEIDIPVSPLHPLPEDKICAYYHIRYIHAPQSLENKLQKADVIVTGFGLTALSAMLHHKTLLILNRSRYHTRCMSIVQGNIQSSTQDYTPTFFSNQYFQKLFTAILDTHPNRCPVCSQTSYRVYMRFPIRSFARCMLCGTHFMLMHTKQPLCYDRNYFNTEYRKQYGKNYLEDFDHIYQIGKKRVDTIRTLLHKHRPSLHRHSPTLIDIGCAYGPFLRAAQDSGFDSYGIDSNTQAIEYAKKHITEQVSQCKIEQFNPEILFGRQSFDVVTMWYVIEHIAKLAPILQKIHAFLLPGGIFAFSTPNRSALPFRADLQAALHSSPIDHYTLWQVKKVRGILDRFGLRVIRVIEHGFTQQHYPNIPNRIGRLMSRWLHYGTTFSVYAKKLA